ncbi:hypothetical protein N7492_003017 [Penicillium capsulatum]|uniref:Uncharacterized protein n=1 Tax=Penicillium capsulatum TaxID=69766 RepID=A0A9W9IL32_9EURO|nr:hypothetical protein N7492_003017 [Penicillium capsulatum]KAJ6122392.1 hypothetical protein N7512_004857 [Penicillium capsulatum]
MPLATSREEGGAGRVEILLGSGRCAVPWIRPGTVDFVYSKSFGVAWNRETKHSLVQQYGLRLDPDRLQPVTFHPTRSDGRVGSWSCPCLDPPETPAPLADRPEPSQASPDCAPNARQWGALPPWFFGRGPEPETTLHFYPNRDVVHSLGVCGVATIRTTAGFAERNRHIEEIRHRNPHSRPPWRLALNPSTQFPPGLPVDLEEGRDVQSQAYPQRRVYVTERPRFRWCDEGSRLTGDSSRGRCVRGSEASVDEEDPSTEYYWSQSKTL